MAKKTRAIGGIYNVENIQQNRKAPNIKKHNRRGAIKDNRRGVIVRRKSGNRSHEEIIEPTERKKQITAGGYARYLRNEIKVNASIRASVETSNEMIARSWENHR